MYFLSSGIWVFLNTGVMAYYWVALFSVYNNVNITAPAAAAGDSKPQMLPV